MKLIVGLGNPGTKYEKTRHNIGFMVVEKFLKDFEPVGETVWVDDKKFKSDIAQIEWQPQHGNLEKVILAKPKTYMNNSGLAVSLLTAYYKLQVSDVWIIHDDIDLPLGFMKIRFGGGSAGHKGAESVMEKVGSDKFWRFRMGIGSRNSEFRIQDSESKARKVKNVEDYVLGEFRGGERGKVKALIKRGAKAIEMGLESGLEAAMNRFNTK
jgi:PTH1 family peptidyl-tRNA hydrolase